MSLPLLTRWQYPKKFLWPGGYCVWPSDERRLNRPLKTSRRLGRRLAAVAEHPRQPGGVTAERAGGRTHWSSCGRGISRRRNWWTGAARRGTTSRGGRRMRTVVKRYCERHCETNFGGLRLAGLQREITNLRRIPHPTGGMILIESGKVQISTPCSRPRVSTSWIAQKFRL
jgi:hypothetical protein